MEALVLYCPTSDQGEGALLSWTLDWLTFDPVTGPPAAPMFSGAANAPCPRRIGSALADVIVALYRYIVRHGGGASDGGGSVATADSAGTRTTVATAVAPLCSVSRDAKDMRWIVLVDLVQLLFSCWELLLVPAPTPSPQQAMSSQVGMRTQTPQEASLPCWTGFFDYSRTNSMPPPLLPGETDDGVPEEALQCPDSGENIALLTAESVHNIVCRVINDFFCVVEDDASAINTGLSSSLLQSPAAATMFLKLVQASSLLRQVVRTSPLLIRSLVRYLLPRLVLLQNRHQEEQQRHHHLSGERRVHAAVVVRAIEALLSTLYTLASPTVLSNTMRSAQPLSTLASQLSCSCWPSDCEVVPASVLADSDGATLLESLRALLQSYSEANSASLRLQALRLLHLLSSSPATRRALLSPHSRRGLPKGPSKCEEQTEPPSAAAAAASMPSSQSPSELELTKDLLPLLLSGEGEEETVELTCSLLQLILLHVQLPCLAVPLCDQYNGAVLDTCTATAGFATALTEHSVVETANDMSGIRVAVHLASHVKDYVMQALYSCTSKTGNALVGLLDLVTSILAGARALLQSANTLPEASTEYDDVAMQWEQRQDWRVILHLAEVDMPLFEALLKGPALHDALVLSNRAGVSNDRSETQFVWDEVACSIVAVAAPERDAQLSLYGLLRCLDALAEGMKGNVQALWSNRLGQLMHELLKRVGQHLEGGGWQPADSTTALRRFGALLISGPPYCTSSEESLAITSLQRARDAADTPLLRRRIDPQTLFFLTRVTATYLAAACDHLTPLGVQLLMDAAQTDELITMRCPAPSGYPTGTSASLEESRCLLRIAALLTYTQLEHWATLAPTYVPTERETLHASNSGSSAFQRLTTPPNSMVERSHVSQCTSRGPGGANGVDNRAGLLDLLLGLYPEAPELLAVRGEFIHALARPHGAAYERPERLPTHASSFIGAASLKEVVMCASDLQASLLLSLATLGCRPCIGRQELSAMLENRCHVLCSRLQTAAPSESARVPAELWSAEEAVECSALNPVSAGTLPDGDNMGLLIDALFEVFTMLVVHTLWYSGNGTAPSTLEPAPAAAVRDDSAVVDCFFSKVHAQELMMCVENSVELRQGLCHYLFNLHTQYRVDVRSFLTRLQSERSHMTWQPPQQTQVSSPVLFAAAVLSVVLYEGNDPQYSITGSDEASPLSTYMRALRSVHWLASTSSQQASVPFSVKLFLRSVFRVAQRELLFLDCRPRPQERQADVPLAAPAAHVAAIESLQFVYTELASQQHGLRNECFPTRCAMTGLSAEEGVQLSASDSLPSVALATCVLREHLVPFILRTDSSSAAHRNNVVFSVTALEYSTVLLQLMSIALWPLGPATCTSLDAVLAEYAMSRVRQLLALTTSEMTFTDGAARKLLFPILQLLYLLLTRAHRVDVMRRYGANVLLFALSARHAAIARASLMVSGEVESSALTDSDVNAVQVCVMASIVYIMAQQIADPKGKGSVAGVTIGCTGDDVCTASAGGAVGVSGAGRMPPVLKDMPWCAWVPVFLYYRLLRTSASRAASDCAVRERRQGVLWVVLSGVEYVIRLCGVSKLSCCSHSAAPACTMEMVRHKVRGGRTATDLGKDPIRDERQAAAILIDWCAEVIFTACVHTGEDVQDASLGIATVSARLLYLLFYRFRTLAASSGWFNALVLSCLRQTTPSRLLRLPLVAEGWLLAALTHVVPNVQHWGAYDDYVKGSVARFFEKPEIAACVKPVPHSPPKEPLAYATALPRIDISEEATTAGSARCAGEGGRWADISAPMPELSCALHVLVTTCRQYELSLHRLRCDGRPTVIIPLGCQFSRQTLLRDCSSVVEYAFPYTVSFFTASGGAPPLLLVFRCFADQTYE
ncbi:hypothetical protein JKF63_01145 [Porcisia hertigi]|uniref:Uncharacterized protein n=1 Tax=Porcisia hertigi TaxID=2761500 RepID=A0A836I8S4_9TRYP|nr:hypothetical protein JKF63_01145 [Porcisia hertigi]